MISILYISLFSIVSSFTISNRRLIHSQIQFKIDQSNCGDGIEQSIYPHQSLGQSEKFNFPKVRKAAIATFPVAGTVAIFPFAANSLDINEKTNLANLFDPSQFQPVCPASDGVYQVLKVGANSLVGNENALEYGPLIASLLLRIRLEICVLESFVNEAVIPFIAQKGIYWILPAHETFETFIAGTIFAVGCNVVLLGSTKIIAVLFLFADFATGFPARLLGSLIKKLSPPNSPGTLIGTSLDFYGKALNSVRSVMEGIDTFVGRYLVLATTIYVGFKLAHFKLFNYFP